MYWFIIISIFSGNKDLDQRSYLSEKRLIKYIFGHLYTNFYIGVLKINTIDMLYIILLILQMVAFYVHSDLICFLS